MSEKKQLTEQELLQVAGGDSEKDAIRKKCRDYNHKGSVKPACKTDPDCKLSRRSLECISIYDHDN